MEAIGKVLRETLGRDGSLPLGIQRLEAELALWLGCEKVSLYLSVTATNELQLWVDSPPEGSDRAPRELRLPAGTGLAGKVAAGGEPVCIPDTGLDPRFPPDTRTRSLVCVPLWIVDGVPLGVIQALNAEPGHEFSPVTLAQLQPVVAMVSPWVAAQQQRFRAGQQRSQMLQSLFESIDAFNPSLGNHSRRVAEVTAEMARVVGLPDSLVDDLRVAGSLHDIGKLGVSQAILMKAGPRTSEEEAVYRHHAVLGRHIVEPLAMTVVSVGVESHHERFDGAGFPDGLAGEAIPLAARIVAVADAYVNLVAPLSRPGAPAPLVSAAAKAEMKPEFGRSFDPDLLAALCAME